MKPETAIGALRLIPLILIGLSFATPGCGSSDKPSHPPVVPSAGKTIRVPDDRPSITAAVSAAESGDSILVSGGTYLARGTINIDKDLVIGSNYIISGNVNDVFKTIIRGNGNNKLFVVSRGARVRIEGLTIENARKPVTIDVGHGIIRHNVIHNSRSDSISFEEDSSGVAEFNTIVDSGDDGLDIDGLRGPYTIRGNTITGSGDDGMEFRMIDSYIAAGSIKYEVYENLIDGTGGDGIQLIDYPADNENRREINIHHNFIKNAGYAGVGTMPDQMTLRGDLPEPYPNTSFAERVFVTNNTIIDNDNGIAGGDNFMVINNIIADNRIGITNLDGNSRLDFTMLLNNSLSGVPPVVQGGNITQGDPELSADGSLPDGSPAIDAGVGSYTWQGEKLLEIKAFAGSAPDLGWKESNAP